MNKLLQRSCNSHVRVCSRNSAVGGRFLPQRIPPCHAVKREVERVPFGDVYLAMQERIATNGTLPKGDGRVLVESIRSLENAQRVLALIAKHVATKRAFPGALELDWPVRKKWLARICHLALRMPNGKPLILDIFANADVFALSTYFAAEMVEELAPEGADAALLDRLVELFRAKRPAGDKGVVVAYRRLLDVLRSRSDEAAAKAVSAALKEYLQETPAGPVPATLTVPATPTVPGTSTVPGTEVSA
ncbi:hypothetical protein PLESTB_001084400 [Pleodorina starrii]|uniref:Uncharacterized protein n=1 Tax=Pleodorina starrii TaxID=330485 RepID=A0A9W6F4I8_9CHLO|nr:hypothetical protein PLESTM_001174300 [Pleodorina starrii]GLC56248.1 hypothetical protein PLESTB_001084400 [Pleodorina starrii]GLC69118.1 hypothetical protein PLESTF_000791800 [Pleodorina starrii]